ncbi:MAG TPA: universal stress protein [Desulfobacteria bacterium]|nr:universal stress protein [Desulfobacteria bacterium]
MFGRILVPVDGSEYSFRAVKAAASMAEKYGSRVTLLYVVSVPSRNPHYLAELPVIPERVVEDLEREGMKILNKAVGEFKEAQISLEVRVGHPAGEILDEAGKGYDLIVLGSRGLGGLREFLLGSVSDRVSHHSKCPVMIIH